MNRLVIFATYWNEIEWIVPSLAQLDVLDPEEIIICDGCFDPHHPNGSTDGTREIIEEYVADRSHARMISAMRLSRLQHYLTWLRPLPHEAIFSGLPARARAAASFHRRHLYRLNQMATFNHMLRISSRFCPGNWFMTYDCDQFYSDDMLKAFEIMNTDTSFNMLTGQEYTFFGDFNHFCSDHEERDHNNMPHRAFSDTRFIPTRHPVRIDGGKYRLYADCESKHSVGIMYHYHVKSPTRLAAGYSLGDRQPPEESRCITQCYTGKHPRIIKEAFLS